jgi:hypothetical protein
MHEIGNFQFDNSFFGLMFIVFFIGLTGGWLVRKGSIFGFIMFFILIVPVAQIVIVIDIWLLTIPFVLGVLIHTFKPLKEKFFS